MVICFREDIIINMKEIAVVKLAPGKVAFYDDYTKIHLTLSNPTASIYEGMNLKRIKNSVKFGVLQVLVGSLNTEIEEVPVKTIHDHVDKSVINESTTEPTASKIIVETVDADTAVENDAPQVEIDEKIVPEEVDAEIETEVEPQAESVETETEIEAEPKPKRGRKKNTEKEVTE